jgi:hypothetical protein
MKYVLDQPARIQPEFLGHPDVVLIELASALRLYPSLVSLYLVCHT